MRLVTFKQTDAPSSLVEEFDLSMASSGKAVKTRGERLITINRISRDLDAAPESLTSRQLMQWFASDMHPNTRASYQSHMRAWFKWLVAMEYRTDDPMMRLGAVARKPTMPRPAATADLDAALATSGLRRRTRMMILLAAYEGLRVHEIAKIRGEDFDWVSRTLTITGKGAVVRQVPISDAVEEQSMNFPTSGYWFPSYPAMNPRAPHISSDAVTQAIRGALERVGSSSKPHALRHWFASEMLDRGADVRTIQELLGHKSLETTAIYTKVKPRLMREAVDLLNAPPDLARVA